MPVTRVRIQFAGNLYRVLGRVMKNSKLAADQAAERTAKAVLRDCQSKTPKESGRAAASWSMRRIGTIVVTFQITSTGIVYMRVLEYGGYPVRKNWPGSSGGFVRGRGRLSGLPPGPKTRRPGNLQIPVQKRGVAIEPALPYGRPINANVSRQAPKGILRTSLITRDKKTLEPALFRSLVTAIRRANR